MLILIFLVHCKWIRPAERHCGQRCIIRNAGLLHVASRVTPHLVPAAPYLAWHTCAALPRLQPLFLAFAGRNSRIFEFDSTPVLLKSLFMPLHRPGDAGAVRERTGCARTARAGTAGAVVEAAGLAAAAGERKSVDGHMHVAQSACIVGHAGRAAAGPHPHAAVPARAPTPRRQRARTRHAHMSILHTRLNLLRRRRPVSAARRARGGNHAAGVRVSGACDGVVRRHSPCRWGWPHWCWASSARGLRSVCMHSAQPLAQCHRPPDRPGGSRCEARARHWARF